MSIQRWIFDPGIKRIVPFYNGDMVKYADHVAAVEAERQPGYDWVFRQSREQAIRDAIQAVKVLGLCNCTALAITADDLHDEWCIERVTVERLALLTEGSE